MSAPLRIMLAFEVPKHSWWAWVGCCFPAGPGLPTGLACARREWRLTRSPHQLVVPSDAPTHPLHTRLTLPRVAWTNICMSVCCVNDLLRGVSSSKGPCDVAWLEPAAVLMCDMITGNYQLFDSSSVSSVSSGARSSDMGAAWASRPAGPLVAPAAAAVVSPASTTISGPPPVSPAAAVVGEVSSAPPPPKARGPSPSPSPSILYWSCAQNGGEGLQVGNNSTSTQSPQ